MAEERAAAGKRGAGETRTGRHPAADSRPIPVFGGPPGRPGPGPVPQFGPKEKAKNIRGTVLRIWDYLRAQSRGLAAVCLLVIIATAVTVITPYCFGVAIDRYIIPGNFEGLLGLAAFLAALYLAQALALWLQSWIVARLSQDTVRAMRSGLFKCLLALPVRFFDRHTRGELMSRLANDVENVNVTLNQGLVLILSSVLTVAGTLAMMIVMSPLLTLVSIIVVPPMLVVTRVVARAARRSFREQQESLGELNGHIEETISGRRVVQAYGRERHTLAAFDVHNGRLRLSGTRALIVSGNMGPYMNLLNNIGFALVAAGGGYLALRHLATAGLIAAFISYARQFSRPVNEIATQYSQIQSAIAGAERVFAIMDEPAEPADSPEAVRLERVTGDVRFSAVSFGYTPGRPVLTDVSLQAAPGRAIALVGPTGAGKTTIVNLLTRFYDVEAGAIHLDGRNIQDISRDSLRSSLGIVLQDTHLFSETVRENIRYGRLGATDAEVLEAARTANAEAFILRLPDGYDTVLSEEGGSLSQGQRQLLAIARAILADPAVLILDEATSSVDTRTELHIQQAMLRLMRGRTSFVIAHRLSTIQDADQILVIDAGRIVERGTHGELLEARGFYWRLHATQFEGEAPPADTRRGRTSMQYTVFMILAPVVAVCMVAAALNVRRQKRFWLSRPLSVSIWMSLGFLVTNTLELAWSTPEGTMLFAKLSYPFSTLIPVAFLLFTLAYTEHAGWFAGARRLILFVIPFLTTALAFTEPLHGLIWATISYTPHGGLLAMNVTYGWFFWVNTIYSVGLLVVSMVLLAWDSLRTARAYRAQTLLAIIGICAPLGLFFVYTFKIFPGFTKNFSPIAYCVPALCFMAAIRQHGFLDFVPIARRALLEEMGDALIVVDAQDRIMDLNEKARAILALPEQAAGMTLGPGSVLHTALDSDLLPNAPQEVTLELRGEKRFYDARVTPVHGSHERTLGSIVLLRDVTDAHRLLEEKNTLIAELSEASAEIRALRGIIPICMYCKKVRDDEGYWHQVETYVSARSLAQFSHGLCPDCVKEIEQNNDKS